MDFSALQGYVKSKAALGEAIKSKRIPHAQLVACSHKEAPLPLVLWMLTQLFPGDPKVSKLIHPDIHFLFPIPNTSGNSKSKSANELMGLFRETILENPYTTYNQWLAKNESAGSSFLIRLEDTKEVLKPLQLKSHEGGYRVLVIWGAEFLRAESANSLLKFIEEPPSNSLIILTTQNERGVLETIRSRTQRIFIPNQPLSSIVDCLVQQGIPNGQAELLAKNSGGSTIKALGLQHNAEQLERYQGLFVSWVRTAFMAKTNAAAVNQLLDWAEELAKLAKNEQREFLHFASEQIREALLIQYGASDLVYQKELSEGFSLEKFAPFIHHNNAIDLCSKIEEASYHVTTSANIKLIFSDLALKMTKLIHTPK